MAERVVLLHGIWNNRPVLWPLAARLRAAGFETETFGYPSVFGGADAAAQQLAAKLRLDARKRKAPAHLVGHSLGGVLAGLEQALRLRFGRHDQLDPVVVEHVHQPGKAPRRVGFLR